MLLFKFIILKLFFYSSFCQDVELKFETCLSAGWTCDNRSQTVTYQCSSNEVLFIEDIFIPADFGSLVVADCLDIRANLVTAPKLTAPLRSLVFKNIKLMNIIPSRENFLIKNLMFKNISLIPFLEENTFHEGQSHFESVIFDNVVFAQISHSAFSSLTVDKEFIFNGVNLPIMEFKAISNLSIRSGLFLITNSAISIIHELALSVAAHQVVINSTIISSIKSEAINVVTDQFLFQDNLIVQKIFNNSFQIISNNIVMVSNHFEYLESDALSGLTPLDPTLPLRLDFTHNHINYTEPNSLVQFGDRNFNISLFQIIYKNNTFVCVWEELCWIKRVARTEFYQNLIGDESNHCEGHPECPLQLVGLISDEEVNCDPKTSNSSFMDLCFERQHLQTAKSKSARISGCNCLAIFIIMLGFLTP